MLAAFTQSSRAAARAKGDGNARDSLEGRLGPSAARAAIGMQSSARAGLWLPPPAAATPAAACPPSEAAPTASITALRRPAPAAWSSTPSRRGTGRQAPPPQHTLPPPRLRRPTLPLFATRTCRTSRQIHSPQQPSLAPTPAPHSARHPQPQPPPRRARSSPWPARLPLGRLAATTRSLRGSTPLAAAARRRWLGGAAAAVGRSLAGPVHSSRELPAT